MKTLIIDGNWLLKKNFHKRGNQKANGKLCGGAFGFLESLKAVLNRTLPDRVVVMWDGYRGGLLRYNKYKPYKANRNKDWEATDRAYATDGTESESARIKVEVVKQKEWVQGYLEDLFIRQAEVDTIEADDLIAYYILNRRPDEEIIINSRDGDFYQLVAPNVSMLTPDKYKIVTSNNFKETFGYTRENALLFKCFEGDSADCIEGIKGITTRGLLEKFPNMANEKYTFNRLVEECYEEKEKKNIKFFDKIIQSRIEIYRNAELMDLKRPFLNDEAKQEVLDLIKVKIDFENRSIKTAMGKFVADGFTQFVDVELVDYFFSVFYNIMNKEKEFSLNS